MNDRSLFYIRTEQDEHKYPRRWFCSERMEYTEKEGFALLLKFYEAIDVALEKQRMAEEAAEHKEAEELRDKFFSKYR